MKPQFTLLYRIWHWSMAFAVIGLLATVALRKTFLSWRDNSVLIQSKLAETGTEITTETAKMIAKAIRAPMWEWHYIFGLVLAISIVIRLYMIASGRAEMPIKTIMKAQKEDLPKHIVHLLLCFSVMFMTLTGGFYYFYEALGFTKEGVHWVKEIHEYTMYGVVGLVVMPLGGVLRHEITTKEGIVSKMIHGDG